RGRAHGLGSTAEQMRHRRMRDARGLRQPMPREAAGVIRCSQTIRLHGSEFPHATLPPQHERQVVHYTRRVGVGNSRGRGRRSRGRASAAGAVKKTTNDYSFITKSTNLVYWRVYRVQGRTARPCERTTTFTPFREGFARRIREWRAEQRTWCRCRRLPGVSVCASRPFGG